MARLGWIVVAAVVLVLLLKTFVGDVYHVVSASMEPTIWGTEGDGEWAFVRFDRSPPARNELVVVRLPGDDTPIVKRVAGMPGESIMIAQGDLLIDRQRRRPSEPRPPEIVLFDDRWHRLEERFEIGSEQARAWRRNGDVWELDAREIAPQDEAGVLRLIGPMNDDYLGPDHELVRGDVQANDARIACAVRFDEPSGAVRLGLKEQADSFEATISRASDTTAQIAITRRRGDADPDVLATARFPLLTGQWTELSFENRDNALRLRFAGPGSPLVVTYKENTPEPQQPEAGDPSGRTSGPRVWLGGSGGRFAFRSIRLARDLVYTSRGRFGVDSEILLGPREYFLLGDNSNQSRDSREWGPVREEEIAGRVARVIWPPSRWRRIPAPAP